MAKKKKSAKARKQEQERIIIAAAAILLIVLFAVGVVKLMRSEGGEEPQNSSSGSSQGTSSSEMTEDSKTGSENSSESKAPSSESKEPSSKTPEIDPYAIPSAAYYGKKLKPVKIDEEKWYLTFVNKEYVLPDEYWDDNWLKRDYVAPGSDHTMDARCAPYYRAMYEAAKKDGCTLTPFSGHRRVSTQKRNFESEMKMYINRGYTFEKAYDLAATNILPPGTSEHNLGLAMDIVSINVNFENSKEFKWLMEHGAEYGFILRYPKDKTDITGIKYEPWHWRYVGKEAATEIMSKGITFEEYLGLA